MADQFAVSPTTNPVHKAFYDVIDEKYRVLTTFDPVDILCAHKPDTIVSLVLHRVAEAMAEPIVRILEPAFQRALKETLEIIQEQKNAKATAESSQADPTKVADSKNTDCTD